MQEEVQPLPSFLRSERTEPGAAAPPPLVPGLGKGPPCYCHPLASAAAFAGLQDSAYATAPVRADRRLRLRLLFPLLRRPHPGSRFAGDAARAPSGPGKSLGARACACAADPSSSPRARARLWPRAGAAWRAGGEVAAAFAGGAHLFARLPLEGRPREGGGQAERECYAGPAEVKGGNVGGSAPLGLALFIRAGGVCAGRT